MKTPHVFEAPGADAIEVFEYTRLVRLPSGDHIDPSSVSLIRIIEQRADGKTGEISASVALCAANNSWIKLPFSSASDAHDFADALARLVNWTFQPQTEARIDRRAARHLIHELSDAMQEGENARDQ